jgi:hypothetical protein
MYHLATYFESWLELRFLLENHSVALPSNIKDRNSSRSPTKLRKLINIQENRDASSDVLWI